MTLDDHRWMCRLCEAIGTGGLGGWQKHYITAHWRLEQERYTGTPIKRYGGAE